MKLAAGRVSVPIGNVSSGKEMVVTVLVAGLLGYGIFRVVKWATGTAAQVHDVLGNAQQVSANAAAASGALPGVMAQAQQAAQQANATIATVNAAAQQAQDALPGMLDSAQQAAASGAQAAANAERASGAVADTAEQAKADVKNPLGALWNGGHADLPEAP